MGYMEYKVINYISKLEEVVRDENSLPADPSDPVDRLISGGQGIILKGGVVA